MNLIEAKNPVFWENLNIIDLDVLVEGREDFIPFTASPRDGESYGRELFERALGGEFGEPVSKMYVEPEYTRPVTEELLEKLARKVEELENRIEEMNNAT